MKLTTCLHDDNRNKEARCVSGHLVPELIAQSIGKRRLYHEADRKGDLESSTKRWTVTLPD